MNKLPVAFSWWPCQRCRIFRSQCESIDQAQQQLSPNLQLSPTHVYHLFIFVAVENQLAAKFHSVYHLFFSVLLEEARQSDGQQHAILLL